MSLLFDQNLNLNEQYSATKNVSPAYQRKRKPPTPSSHTITYNRKTVAKNYLVYRYILRI
jgi:hypothetical protein